MVRGLSGRVALLLLALILLVAGLYSGFTLFATRRHFQEVTQKLHRSLAESLTRENELLRGGRVDRRALEQISHAVRVINPSVEVYLLDAEGEILAFSAPPGTVRRDRVALTPLANFLSGSRPLPILGDDPQDPERNKVFSAFPVKSSTLPNANTEGYLYIILGGQEFDSVAKSLQGSFVLRLIASTAVAFVLLVAIAGLVILRVATRPVRNLSGAMRSFRRAHLPELGVETDEAEMDEIASLESLFRQMAQKITQQMRRLKETDALRRDLIANVSHDLRTPLASLQGYLETLILKEGRLSADEEQNCLRVAFKHSVQLGKLVSGLFELTTLEAQETPIKPEPFSIAELVQDVVQKFRIAAEKRRVSLQAHFQEDLPYVLADVSLIERVLENLIQNALRHTPEKGNVDIRLIQKAEEVIVEVADSGAGIPDKELPYIFDRFYQAGDASHRAAGRAGLGLAIVQRILELHGSRVEVESELEKGTTFRFRLPRQSTVLRRTTGRSAVPETRPFSETAAES